MAHISETSLLIKTGFIDKDRENSLTQLSNVWPEVKDPYFKIFPIFIGVCPYSAQTWTNQSHTWNKCQHKSLFLYKVYVFPQLYEGFEVILTVHRR